MKYLGLDVSTSCTGLCLLNEEGEIEKLGYVDLTKFKGLLTKADKFQEEFVSWLSDIDPNQLYVAVEEAAQAYRPGLSSAKTIATLNQFNGMIQLVSSQLTKNDVKTILPVLCRSASGIKLISEKKCGISTKDQVRAVFEEQTGRVLPSKKLKSGPRKDMMVFDVRNYDTIDAWVVSRWLWLNRNNS